MDHARTRSLIIMVITVVAACTFTGTTPRAGEPDSSAAPPLGVPFSDAGSEARPISALTTSDEASSEDVAIETQSSSEDTAAGTPSILRGQATWYNAPNGTAAAGPRLRHWLGHAWRDTAVDVCREGPTWIACTRVRLTDWCACGGDRIIDLNDQAFAALAPLSKGVIRVKIAVGAPPRESITNPPTDTAP